MTSYPLVLLLHLATDPVPLTTAPGPPLAPSLPVLAPPPADHVGFDDGAVVDGDAGKTQGMTADGAGGTLGIVELNAVIDPERGRGPERSRRSTSTGRGRN